MISVQTARRAIWRPLWELPTRLELILSLAKRDLLARYKGSALGILWAIITPVVTIAIFTFIFAGIFGARFGSSGTKWDYAVYLFCGLLPWSMFQESVQQSALTIVNHANLVKRVVFPLEVLPIAQSLAALGTQLFGTVALIACIVILHKGISPTILWLPVLLIPQLLMAIGAAWLVAALGVFLRDIAQGLGLLLMAWMFLTPIIYPETVVPEHYRRFIEINPFTALMRSYRRIFIEGTNPDWNGLGYFFLIAVGVFGFGYWWFARSRKNFADVV